MDRILNFSGDTRRANPGKQDLHHQEGLCYSQGRSRSFPTISSWYTRCWWNKLCCWSVQITETTTSSLPTARLHLDIFCLTWTRWSSPSLIWPSWSFQVSASVDAYETALQIRINCFGKNNLQVGRKITSKFSKMLNIWRQKYWYTYMRFVSSLR